MSHFSLPPFLIPHYIPPSSLHTKRMSLSHQLAFFLLLQACCLSLFSLSHPLFLSLIIFQLLFCHFLPVTLTLSLSFPVWIKQQKNNRLEMRVRSKQRHWFSPFTLKIPLTACLGENGWPDAKVSKCDVNERSRYIWYKSWWFECTTDLKHWDLVFIAHGKHF